MAVAIIGGFDAGELEIGIVHVVSLPSWPRLPTDDFMGKDRDLVRCHLQCRKRRAPGAGVTVRTNAEGLTFPSFGPRLPDVDAVRATSGDLAAQDVGSNRLFDHSHCQCGLGPEPHLRRDMGQHSCSRCRCPVLRQVQRSGDKSLAAV